MVIVCTSAKTCPVLMAESNMKLADIGGSPDLNLFHSIVHALRMESNFVYKEDLNTPRCMSCCWKACSCGLIPKNMRDTWGTYLFFNAKLDNIMTLREEGSNHYPCVR